MAGDPRYPISKTSNFGVNDIYILGHAARNLYPKPDKIEHLTSSSKLQSQIHLRAQIPVRESTRNRDDLATNSQTRPHLPLNMIVSKSATRKPLQESNTDPLEGFDLSSIRNSKLLEPLWREKEVNRRSLQSAYCHNRQKIDEIQAMKAKLKCPWYDPYDLVKNRRYHHQQGILSESDPFLRKEDTSRGGRFSQLYQGCQRLPQTKPLVMESEDPLQDTSRGGRFSHLYQGCQSLPQTKPLVMESEDPLQDTSRGERFSQLYQGCQRLPQTKPLVMESQNPLQDTSRGGRFSQLYQGCQRLPQNKPLVMESEDPLQDTSRGGRFSQRYQGCQRLPQTKPLVMESEDPLLEDANGDNQMAFEQLSNEKENLTFSSTPIIHPTKDKFVWNPVIFPAANSVRSARELLEYHYSPQFVRKNAKEWFDSPGKHTTSSTSSGLTVAEETVRLTYYAGRSRGPVKDESQARRKGGYGFNCDPFDTTVEDWLPNSCRPDFINYSEE